MRSPDGLAHVGADDALPSAEIDDLVDCILAGRETMLNVFDAQKTMEICIAADQSGAQGGKPVALPLLGDD